VDILALLCHPLFLDLRWRMGVYLYIGMRGWLGRLTTPATPDRPDGKKSARSRWLSSLLRASATHNSCESKSPAKQFLACLRFFDGALRYSSTRAIAGIPEIPPGLSCVSEAPPGVSVRRCVREARNS